MAPGWRGLKCSRTRVTECIAIEPDRFFKMFNEFILA